MLSPTTTEARPPALGSGTPNTTRGSQVPVSVAPAPMAYLRLDTGEVYAVPATDETLLNNEFDKWNRLIYEQLLANEVLALADERLMCLATEKANKKFVPANIEKDAIQSQQLAVQWREQATEAVRKEMQALDKLGSSGKTLIEMMPLMEKPVDKPYKVEADKDNGQWKRKGLDLNKVWGFKSAAGIKEHFKQEARYKGVGPLRYMSSDKLKGSWPKFKDAKADGTKWADVYKADASGKRKVDRSKLKSYLGEQVQQAKLKSSDFIKLEVSHTQTLGPEALEKWNSNAHAEGEGQLVWGDSQLGDVDFSAEAAAMRFYSGGSLSAELAPLKGNVSLKAEGSVEVAFAEGKVGGNLYLPSKEGVMLYYLDVEQLVDLASGEGVDTGRYDLGAIRLQCGAELKGVIGVSLAGEGSIGVEMKDIDSTDVDGKTKPGKMPRLKGSRKKAQRRKAVDVTGTDDTWKNTAGVAAEVNFFAGAKGGLGISGSVQWRNPHSKEKKFEPFASIAPELQGMLGLAGEAKLNIEYTEGIFRITAHAGLCVGVGAEGTFTFAVGAKQLASFVYWMYYNLLHAGFRSLVFITKEAFAALKYLGYLMVVEGKEVATYFGRQLELAKGGLEKAVLDWNTKFRQESETLALAQRVLSHLDRVRFSTPESKGMLIYQLTRFGSVSWALDGGGLGSAYLPTQRKAVLAVLRQATISNDLKNVIEHIQKEGKRVSLDRNLNELRNFFAAEGPGGLNVPGTRTDFQDEFQKMVRKTIDPDFIAMGPAGQVDQLAMNGDFQAWYDTVLPSLMVEPMRGQVALASSDPGYALLRDGPQQDHPLFASSAGGYYSDVA